MALRFIDSFDHYTSSTQKWEETNAASIVAGAGRRATSALRLTSTNPYARKIFAPQAAWIVGCALKLTATGTFLVFADGTNDQVYLFLANDGRIEIRNGAGIALATSTFALVSGEWYYVECKATIHGANGSCEVRIDGISRVSLSNVNTQSTGNPQATTVGLGARYGASSSPSFDVDDFYICDLSGAQNNNFLGPYFRVDAVRPNDNGNASQLLGSDANSVNNYLLVDESAPNSDTDYVESDVVGNKDLYAMFDLTHAPNAIFGVQTNLFARKNDAGYRALQSVARSGGADYDGASTDLLSTYAYYRALREVDPATGLPWTVSGFNAAQFGVKVAG